FGQAAFGGRGGRRGVLLGSYRPCQHPPYVRVQDGVPSPVREAGDGGGRVLADARQGEERRVVGRGLAAVPLGDAGGAGVQAHAAGSRAAPTRAPPRRRAPRPAPSGWASGPSTRARRAAPATPASAAA